MKSFAKPRAVCSILIFVSFFVLITFDLTSYSSAAPSEIEQNQDASLSKIEKFSFETVKKNRNNSAQKLKKIGLAVLCYADDSNGTLPDNLQQIKPYIQEPAILEWAIPNVEYLPKGLNINKLEMDFACAPMAYDISLPRKDYGTNLLFLDGHVEFVNITNLKKYGIVLQKIQLGVWLMSVSSDNEDIKKFLTTETFAKASPVDSNHPDAAGFETLPLILSEKQILTLLKSANSDPRSEAHASTRATVYNSQPFSYDLFSNNAPFITGVSEKDLDANGSPKPITENIKIGTTFKITPRILDGNNIFLDVSFDYSQIDGYKKVTFMEKYSYINPVISAVKIRSKCIVPDGARILLADAKTKDKWLLASVKAELIKGPLGSQTPSSIDDSNDMNQPSSPSPPDKMYSNVTEKIGPVITFEKTTHDFGRVSLRSVTLYDFKFTNTGDEPLKILVASTKGCSCTASVSPLKIYKPGESGKVTVNFNAGKVEGLQSKEIVVSSNDKNNPNIKLTLKAEVVKMFEISPDALELSLKKPNGGCPDITIESCDGKPFAIKSLQTISKNIRADFDPNKFSSKFVLKPVVDLAKLKESYKGIVQIELVHPDCNQLVIEYSAPPLFIMMPPIVLAMNSEPLKPVIRDDIFVLSGYGEDFEIESAVSRKNIIEVLGFEKVSIGRFRFTLRILPPALVESAKAINYFDDLDIKIKGGEQITIQCKGYYAKKAQNPAP